MTPEGLPGGIFRFLWQVRATDPLLLLAWLPRCAVPVLSMVCTELVHLLQLVRSHDSSVLLHYVCLRCEMK